MSATLVVLLSLSQFPPASGSITSKLIIENDPGLPGVEQPGNENPDLLLADILDEPAFHRPQSFRYGIVSGRRSVGAGLHATFSDIRAPPQPS